MMATIQTAHNAYIHVVIVKNLDTTVTHLEERSVGYMMKMMNEMSVPRDVRGLTGPRRYANTVRYNGPWQFVPNGSVPENVVWYRWRQIIFARGFSGLSVNNYRRERERLLCYLNAQGLPPRRRVCETEFSIENVMRLIANYPVQIISDDMLREEGLI